MDITKRYYDPRMAMVVAGTAAAKRLNSERKRAAVRESPAVRNTRMVAFPQPTASIAILDEVVTPFVSMVALMLWTLVVLEACR